MQTTTVQDTTTTTFSDPEDVQEHTPVILGQAIERANELAKGAHDHSGVILGDIIFQPTSAHSVAAEWATQTPFGQGSQSLHINHLALGQMVGHMTRRTNVVRAIRYLRSLGREGLADLVALNLQGMATLAPLTDYPLYIRAHGDVLRAVGSGDRYQPYDNHHLLADAAHAFSQMDTQVPVDKLKIKARQTRDDLYLKVELMQVDLPPTRFGPEDQHWSIGVSITNDEVLRGALYVHPFIKRTSCDNSIIIDSEGSLRANHVHSRGYMRNTLIEGIGAAFRVGPELLNRVLATIHIPLPTIQQVIDQVAQNEGLTDNLKGAVLRGTEGKATLGGLINGLTFAAHTEATSIDQQMRLEKLAGGLATGPQIIRELGLTGANRQAMSDAIQMVPGNS